MKTIKAIQTFYNGYHFRSRLEARWAVFFDTLGIRYEYEPEGYILSDGTWYLPDFYLPHIDKFLEIKPSIASNPNEESVDHNGHSDNHLSDKLIVLSGPIGLQNNNRGHLIPSYGGTSNKIHRCVFYECNNCHFVGIHYTFSYVPLIKCNCENRLREDCLLPDSNILSFRSSRMISAYNTARSARFEHGQKGASL